jgi:hypothetical protein
MKQVEYNNQFKISIEILKDYKPVYVSNFNIFKIEQIDKCLNEALGIFGNTKWVKEMGYEFKYRICGEYKIVEDK